MKRGPITSLVILLAFSFSACGGGAESTPISVAEYRLQTDQVCDDTGRRWFETAVKTESSFISVDPADYTTRGMRIDFLDDREEYLDAHREFVTALENVERPGTRGVDLERFFQTAREWNRSADQLGDLFERAFSRRLVGQSKAEFRRAEAPLYKSLDRVFDIYANNERLDRYFRRAPFGDLCRKIYIEDFYNR